VAEDSPGTLQPLTRKAEGEAQVVQPEQSGNRMSEESPSGQPWFAKTWAVLNPSLSRVQAIVGLVAGIISVTGALYSVTQFFRPAPGMGEVVAVVQEAKTEKGMSDATIEILTPQNALVATLTSDVLGRARQTLKEGTYRVFVSHPRYAAEVRQIQVFSRQTVEVKLRLRAGSSSSLAHAGRAVNEGVGAVRRAFGF
jgi:hypothetical protein